MTIEKVELPVIGMTCANCASSIERALRRKVEGVSNAVVNFAAETVVVEYDSAVTDTAKMAAAVERAGYKLVLPDNIGAAKPAIATAIGNGDRGADSAVACPILDETTDFDISVT